MTFITTASTASTLHPSNAVPRLTETRSSEFAAFINSTESNSGSFSDGSDLTDAELLAFERRFTGLGTNALTVNLD